MLNTSNGQRLKSTQTKGVRRPVVVAASCLTLGLASVGCSAGGTATSADSGVSVAYGASMEDYHSALADMQPITLNVQSPGAKGSHASAPLEAYVASISEWSDNRIEFDMTYSSAVAAPGDIANAVEDGRLDIAIPVPANKPESFPEFNSLLDLGFEVRQEPMIGPMQSMGAMLEVASDSAAIDKEFADNGLVPLVPFYSSGLESLVCSEPGSTLDDLDGLSVRAGTRVTSQQIDALGMNAISLPYPEVYEGLQRGVVDCAVASPPSGIIGGIYEIAPYVTIDPEVGFSLGAAGVVINEGVWESLPLAAQQLLHDRVDAFLAQQLTDNFESYVEMVNQVEQYGGEISPFAEDARQALQEYNDKILAESDLGETVSTASDKWFQLLTVDLAMPTGVTPLEFAEQYQEEETREQLVPFIEILFDDVLNNHRPA